MEDVIATTDGYMINVLFEKNLAGEIFYGHTQNPQKALIAIRQRDRDRYFAELVPLTTKEIQSILTQHSGSNALPWTAAGENSWKRWDGAMARYKPEQRQLLIATAAGWEKTVALSK